ncbi:ABC transporter permease [Agromyces archimandritae]|uniref:ABC transporter permease n=1 Tax=Agromyces archimandritae TaxID=2781962 RepID=A0A975FL52_9MICO|nr:ABC transporter permease [Agromyces archimandritae]QTX03448.1 ABC transporter permease [Agromyces archimandritae]
MRALASEYLKVVTTRAWWIMLVLLVAYVGLLAGGFGAFLGWAAENPGAAAGASTQMPSGLDPAPLVYAFASSIGFVFPFLLGALAVTGEFRHATLTPTFLATPNRATVLWAKFGVLIAFGAVFGVAAFAATMGAGGGALAAFGIDPGFGDSETWAMAARGVLAMALWAAIGVGLGVLVPNQVAAIVIVIAFTQFLEPILRLVFSLNDVTAVIGRFLPGAASDALVGPSFYSIAGMGQSEPLEWWIGGLVLAAIAIVLTAIGSFTSWRRDIT